MPIARSYTLPAPIGGLNAKDAEDQMDEVYALDCLNWFPQTNGLELRRGYSVHATGLGGTVETLVEYAEEDGTRSLIGAANGEIWDATAAGAASSLGSGFTEDRWQTVTFKNTLILVNGTDTPQKYDGSTLGAATYTGIGTPANLISPHVYRNRLYFVEAGTASFWYGGTGSITGALTEFDTGGYLKKGGFLMFAGSYSQATGENEADRFVLVSNMGEVLVYAGIDPGSTWTLVGRYYTAAPLGRRAFFNKDSEMAVITNQGVIPISKLLTSSGSLNETEVLTYNIQDKFRRDAINYSSNIGWEGLVYPRGNMAIINVPTATNSTAKQYVLNTLTGAWSEFSNINAFCWSLLNYRPYFGAADGKVYRFDTGSNDNGNAIPTKLRIAYTYLGDRAHIKRLLQVRPLMRSSGEIQFLFGADADFNPEPLMDTITTIGSSGAVWDSAEWDVAEWDGAEILNSGWEQVYGLGRTFALRMEADLKNITGSLQAINLTYETGGYM